MLSSQIEVFDDRPVTGDILNFKMVEQAAALSHKLQQSTLGVEVFFVNFQMLCHVSNTMTEKRDLAFSGSGVGFCSTEFFEDFLLYFCVEVHFTYFFFVSIEAQRYLFFFILPL